MLTFGFATRGAAIALGGAWLVLACGSGAGSGESNPALAGMGNQAAAAGGSSAGNGLGGVGGLGGASGSVFGGQPAQQAGSAGNPHAGSGGVLGTAGTAGSAGNGGSTNTGGSLNQAGGSNAGSAGSGNNGGSGSSGGMGGTPGLLETFVTRQGLQFMAGGKRHVFVGANFWQGMNLAAATSAGGDLARLRRELDRLKALGVTNVRVIAASEGPDSAPYRVTPALMPMPGVYNEQIFKGLDTFLNELSLRGIRAVMVLNNYWEWTGGMGQYVSWSDGSKIPYRLDPGGDYNTFIKYVDRFYACTSCQTAYRAHIKTVIARVNTVNGRSYKDDPVIFSWQLANEPRDYPANWINDTAQYIKSLDANHLVSVGSEGTWGGDFVATHQSQYVDYTTCHIWVEPWGKYDPNNSSASALQTATDFATGYLRDHDTAAKKLGKPLVLEEFGLARDGWTAGGKYDPAATTSNRDKYYKSLYAVVEASLAASGGALAGDNFWAWGGEVRPPSKWAGDPPHETPGWFSVYDTDQSTTALIAMHGSTLAQTK